MGLVLWIGALLAMAGAWFAGLKIGRFASGWGVLACLPVLFGAIWLTGTAEGAFEALVGRSPVIGAGIMGPALAFCVGAVWSCLTRSLIVLRMPSRRLPGA